MQRTTKEERKRNANNFYQLFNNHEENIACIVVERNDNNRTQFVTVPGSLNWSNPIVIAENSALGVEGCWIELIKSIKGGIKQTTYFEDDFKEWLKETMGFEITYYDGLVFVLEKVRRA